MEAMGVDTVEGTVMDTVLAVEVVEEVAAYAAMAPDQPVYEARVVNHPHDPHSHHLEGCYAHPVGHQEGDPQEHILVDAYLDTLGTTFRQKVLG